jgi:2'-5' RNA ligase
LSLIERHLIATLKDVSPFCSRFSAIRSFPKTGVFYLEPSSRSPFDHLHQKLLLSGISFSESQWPFNPHCTVRVGDSVSGDAAVEIASRPLPLGESTIDTVSVYHLDASFNCKLLFQQQTLRA